MNDKHELRVLLVEDNASDAEALSRAFSALPKVSCELTHVGLLSEAVEALGSGRFDIVLLDLGLPDSRGVDTFVQVHEAAPSVPVLVLARNDEDAWAQAALSQGALDYLVKQQLEAPLLVRTIRYAIERAQLQQQLSEARLREDHASEIRNVERISDTSGTSVTARMYSGSSLRESAAQEFAAVTERYAAALDLALEERLYKEHGERSELLRELGTDLGFLRAAPRDVIDVHTSALKTKTENAHWQKAQAYLEEGRLTVLELMGYLVGYYRSINVRPASRDGTHG